MACSGAYRRYMAISAVREYAHLTADDVEAIGEELEAIRQDVVDWTTQDVAPDRR